MESTAAHEHAHELQALESLLLAEHTLARHGFPPPIFAQRYTLMQPLGRGARGMVWRARDGKMNRDIALKLYPYHEGDRLVDEVTREAQALARLRHPAVVQVFDFGHGAFAGNGRECLYVAMECLEGQPLRSWLAEPRSAQAILLVFIRAGEGLFAAHQRKLIHRDFKPDNVVLEVDGSPRIVDFGLASAEIVASRADGSERTPGDLRNRALGTPAYLAPEAIAGQADARSDQFSFAASLWQALFGVFPYDEHAMDSLSRATLREPPSREGLGLHVVAALRRALAPAPSARFPDMGQLLTVLRDFDRPPLDAVPEIQFEPPTRPGRRGPWIAGIALLAAGSAGFGLWAITPEEAGPAESEPGPVPIPVTAPRCVLDPVLAGQWGHHTSVVWSEFVDLIGVSGHYVVDFTSQEACRYDVLVTKTGDSGNDYPEPRRARESLQATKTPPFQAQLTADVWLAKRSDAELAQPTAPDRRRRGGHYLFDYTIDGERMLGHWRYLSEVDGHVIMAGALRGGRAAPASMPAGIADLPCRSQCALRCAGVEAETRCLHGHCDADPRARVDDCGAPDLAFLPSAQTLPGSVVRFYNPASAKKPLLCRVIAEQLAGAWTLHTRASTGTRKGQTVSYEVDFTVDGCTLRGTGRQSDRSKPLSLEGEVRADGVWTVRYAGSGRAGAWTLTGWDPAFGRFATADGLISGPMSAYRVRR